MVRADNQAYMGAVFLGLFALRFIFRILDAAGPHMPTDGQHFVAIKLEPVE